MASARDKLGPLYKLIFVDVAKAIPIHFSRPYPDNKLCLGVSGKELVIIEDVGYTLEA